MVDKGKGGHQQLAVHAVCDAAVARDKIAEVLRGVIMRRGATAAALMRKARLTPEAKKPPNGATSDENTDMASAWNRIGYTSIVAP